MERNSLHLTLNTTAVEGIDPDTNEVIEITPADYLFGLNELLDALEGINGLTPLDKRGELRTQFYTELRRRPGERLSEFCTRFRTTIADLRAEGVVLPTTEVGWFFRDKLGLDPLRKQLLDTALHGREEYEIIESEALRLFKDLHVADPLYRNRTPDRKLTVRRMFQTMGNAPSSSGMSSSASTTSSRHSQSSRFSDSSRRSSIPPGRKVLLTEVAETEEPDDQAVEEVNVAEVDESEAGLEDMLRSEAEVLAAELQEAEDQGIDTELLESIEGSFEQAAETLVTMKEARDKLQEIKKDRGYNKPKPPSKFSASTPASKKNSGSHPCFDCMEHGHWAGDPECKRPGAGLGRKPGAKSKPAKQVRLTETLEVDGSVGEKVSPSGGQSPIHEASMVVHYSGMSLGQALHQTLINHEHSTMSSSNSRVLEEDKHLVGALDSACKRTCAGPQWLDRYLLKLKSAPSEISGLITSVDESENFRFGNGGVVPSGKRWRLPCSIGGCIVLVWVSLVPVTSLGCLLGRDFLDAVGAVLNFGQRTLDCTFLGTGTQRLQQMAAGHFMLQMIPEQWTRPAPGRWRKCGQDGIVELQLTSKEWLNRVLREGHNIAGADSHDHMLTESSLMAGRAVLELHDAFESTSDNGGPLAQEMRFSRSCSEVRQQRVLAGSFQNEQFSEVNGCRVEQHRAYEIGPGTTSPKDADGRISVGLRTISVEKVRAPNVGSKGLALVRIATLAAAAILFAVLAISLSVDLYTDGMVPSDASHGSGQVTASSSLPHLGEEPGEVFHSWQFGRTWNISQSCGPGRCIHGGQDVDGHVGCEIHEGTVSSLEGISHSRGQEEGRSREERCKPRIGGQIYVGTSGRSSSIEGRFDSFGCSTACGSGCERHGADDSGQDSAYGAAADEQQSWVQGLTDQDGSRGQAIVIGEPITRECTDSSVHEVFMVAGGGLGGGPHGAGRKQNDGHDGGTRAKVSVDDASGDDSRDGNAATCGAACGGHHGGGRDDGLNSGFRLANAKSIKKGVRMMITQAWEKHRRDQKAVSIGTREVMEVLTSTWEREMRDAMHETFSAQLTFPNPFLAEVFTDTEQVAKATTRKGLIAGESLSLMTGWDFQIPSHRDAARLMIKRLRPYVLVLAFPCGPWSQLQNLNPTVLQQTWKIAERRPEN